MELVTVRGVDGRYWSTSEKDSAAAKLLELVRVDDGLVALRAPGTDALLSDAKYRLEGDRLLHAADGTAAGSVEEQSALLEAMRRQQNCCGTGAHEHEANDDDTPRPEWNDEQHRSVLNVAVNKLASLAGKEKIGPAAKRVHELCTSGNGFRQAIFDGLYRADYADEYTGTFLGARAYYLHFYDPDTNGHYMPNVPGLTKGDGKTSFAGRFGDAISFIPEKNPKEAGFQLGLALHYLTDLSQPMHAANFPNLWVGTVPDPWEWRHSNFETYADDKKIPEQWWDGEYDPAAWGKTPEEVIVAVARKGKRLWTKGLKAHVDARRPDGKFGAEVDPSIVEAVRLGYEATIMALIYFGQQARR